jgi:nucleotide-binding universal stress UspA family protein
MKRTDDARAVLDRARTIVAYTDDDGRYRHVRNTALEAAARSGGGRVILYALDEYSPLTDPVPNEWASDRPDQQFSDPLGVHDLERLGREALAAQLREAGGGKVEVGAALPRHGGVDAMVDYAEQHGAEVVLLPVELEEDTGFIDRLVGRTEDKAAEVDAERRPVVLFVGADGQLQRAAEEKDDG